MVRPTPFRRFEALLYVARGWIPVDVLVACVADWLVWGSCGFVFYVPSEGIRSCNEIFLHESRILKPSSPSLPITK